MKDLKKIWETPMLINMEINSTESGGSGFGTAPEGLHSPATLMPLGS